MATSKSGNLQKRKLMTERNNTDEEMASEYFQLHFARLNYYLPWILADKMTSLLFTCLNFNLLFILF